MRGRLFALTTEPATTATDLYIRTSGLRFHVMGPWYLNAGKTNLFPTKPHLSHFSKLYPTAPSSPQPIEPEDGKSPPCPTWKAAASNAS